MMQHTVNRRHFLAQLGLAAGALALPSTLAAQQDKPKPPPLPLELVKEFVGAGHSNLPKVKEMLAATPSLLNACYDWKDGDFETAIEGAAHMGNAEIANYLIGQGARANLFVFAMLGKLELVKGIIALHPQVIHSTGAHGISLLTHAKKGGDNALAVVEYLQTQGIKG